MAAKPSPPVSPRSSLLLDPPEYLVFKVPEAFDRRTVTNLTLTNTSQRRIGFKMRCTAAQYYGADPATGIVEPDSKYTVSVCLWEQPEMKLSQLDWKKHKFGISYLVVSNDCIARDIDTIVKDFPRNVKSAVLKCSLCNDDDLISSVTFDEDHHHPQKFGSIRPISDRDQTTILEATLASDQEEIESLKEELVLKDSVICELERKEKKYIEEIHTQKIQLERQEEMNQQLKKDRTDLQMTHQKEFDLSEENKQIIESLRLFNEEMKTGHQREIGQLMEANEQLMKERDSAQLFVEEMKRAPQRQTLDISFWEVSCKDVEVGKEIGRGAYATVYEGRFMEQKVAVKSLHKVITSKHHIELLHREVSLLARVRHPNLLLFIAVAFDHKIHPVIIITELMATSLREAYSSNSLLKSPDYMQIMYDVACALHYLHSQKEPILHRDVSSANVLLQQLHNTWRGKISDFGSANLAMISVTTVPGAWIYTAPEIPRESVIDDKSVSKQTTKVDVFSYGVLLCEVFTEKPQLPTSQSFHLMLESVNVRFPKMHNVVNKCIERDPLLRPTMESILKEFRKTFHK